MIYLPRGFRSPPHAPPPNPRQHRGGIIAAGQVSMLLAALALANGQTGADDDRPKVKAVRYWSLGDITRIVIEATGEFQFRSDRIYNPDRLFFDLTGATPDIGPKGLSTIPVNDRFIRQIRVAETQHGVTRVVLDLATDVKFTTSQLANPDRLIVEVHSARETAHFEPPPRRQTPVVTNSVPPPVVDPPDGLRKSRASIADPLAAVSRATSINAPPPPMAAPVLAKTTLAPYRNEATSPATVSMSMPVATPVGPEELGMPAKHGAKADTMIRILGLKLHRVVLDPGHGGYDAGTSGSEGLREKDVALDVCKRLGGLIQERLGSEVLYTRTDDTFIPLTRRTQIANEANADLFLSIHVNSSPYRAAAGVETYYLNFTTSRTALDTAARENAGAEQSIHDLRDLLQKIALKDKVEESREFASRLQTSLIATSARVNHDAKNRGTKKAPFVVLIGAQMPAVLVEIGFITNSQDASMMRRGEYRQRIAEALYKGLSSYANTLSHFQVAQRTGTASGQ